MRNSDRFVKWPHRQTTESKRLIISMKNCESTPKVYDNIDQEIGNI